MPDSSWVHVIDDDQAMRESLQFLLRAAKLNVRSYDSAKSFLETYKSSEPGCVVTDVRMPEITGIELLRLLKKHSIDLPVVVITGHGDVALAVEAMKAGAVDFLEKPFSDERILQAIEFGLKYRQKRGARSAERSIITERLGSLSHREKQVLDGLVAGAANKAIAHDLDISPRTVEIYRANVMTKMGAKSLSELVRMVLLIADGDQN